MTVRWRLAAVASYVVLAVLVVGPGALLTQGTVAGQGLDLPGTIWIHWWVGRCTEALTFPVSTDLLFYPDGKNLFADTGGNYVDAWIGLPFQWLLGVPDFLDALDVLVLVGNALAMQALVTTLTEGRSPGTAWAAAVAFLLNPFAAQQVAEGRPTQALSWFGVLAVRELARIEAGPRHAVGFGAMVALQAMTYWFTAYFLAIGLFPFAFAALARNPRVVAPRLTLAVATTLLLTSPFLVGIAGALDRGEALRTAFDDWRDGPVGQPARWHLVADQLLSATTLATVALAAWAGRRAWPLLAGAALAALFSCGARLDLANPPLINPLFVGLWKALPMLPRLGFPERAAMATWILLPAAGALGLRRVDPVYALLFGLVAAGEGFWRNAWPVATTTYTVSPAAALVKDGAVIHLPFAAADDAMVLQTVHGQPLFGGMGEREADMRPAGFSARLQNGFYAMLAGTLNDRSTPIAYSSDERAAIVKQYRWVWLDRTVDLPDWSRLGYDPDAKVRALARELGDPVFADARVALWDLSAPAPAEPPGEAPGAVRTGDEVERLANGQLVPDAPRDLRR